MISFSKIIDISWPITVDMTAYKDQKEVVIEHKATYERDGYRKTTVRLSAHAGTHVDAPSHFIERGHTIDQMAMSHLIGQCVVLDMTNCVEKITEQDVKQYELEPGCIVVLKTKNSFLSPTAPFDQHFIYIDASAALWLAKKKIKAIAIDYIGIERHQPGHETHDAFFSHGIAIIEGVRLEHVTPGAYDLVCLPLHLIGLDGAPARVVLLEQ